MCMTECLCVCVILLCVYTVHSVNSISGSDGKHSSVKSTGSEGSCSLTTVDFKSFKVSWNQEIHHNRETWKAQAAKGSHTDLLNISHSNDLVFTRLFLPDPHFQIQIGELAPSVLLIDIPRPATDVGSAVFFCKALGMYKHVHGLDSLLFKHKSCYMHLTEHGALPSCR